MFNSIIFTTDVFEQLEVFAFEDNENHRGSEGNFMNKFHCAALCSAIVKSLGTMKLSMLLEIVLTKAFHNFYLSRK